MLTLLFAPEAASGSFCSAMGFVSETCIKCQVQCFTLFVAYYRSGSTLASDPESGRVLMFAGNSGDQFRNTLPSEGKFFNDVWELWVDLPGSDFDKIDIKKDKREVSVVSLFEFNSMI